jgi:hypothetical protein
MCTQKPPHDYSKQLYERYKKTLEDYIKSIVRALILVSICTSIFGQFHVYFLSMHWIVGLVIDINCCA